MIGRSSYRSSEEVVEIGESISEIVKSLHEFYTRLTKRESITVDERVELLRKLEVSQEQLDLIAKLFEDIAE